MSRWFEPKGFIVAKSSDKCYHVVFDCKVSWKKEVNVMAQINLQSHNRQFRKGLPCSVLKKFNVEDFS